MADENGEPIYNVDFNTVSIENINGKSNIQTTENIINNINIYPNPAKDNLNINYYLTNDGLVTISLYNVLGEKVVDVINDNQVKGSHNSNIDLKSVSAGVYTIKMTSGVNNTIVKRIVVNK